MRKCLLLLAFLLLPFSALADELSFTVSPKLVRPGRIERISISSPADGEARLELLSEAGESLIVIRSGLSVSQGVNHLTWDGTDISGEIIPMGDYVLSVSVNGESAHQAVTVGEPSPQILSVSAKDTLEKEDEGWPFTVEVNEPGTLILRLRMDGESEWQSVYTDSVTPGESTHVWDGAVNEERIGVGRYTVQFILTDDTGFSSTAQQLYLTVLDASVTPSPEPTPEPRILIPSAVTTPEEETSYWTMPLGVFDEEAIWNIMMQPMTVIEGNQKEVYRLRANPDNSTAKENIVGEITYASQGVHVLETRNDGWTLVEAYNSSYGPNCASRRGYGVTDDLIRGYVKTSLLKTVNPRMDYGLLIDKLEQVMYIFSEGKCIGSLLVSTGLNNAKQSWNETPAGEFVMISRMGDFPAGNLWCRFGMRINGGSAIHEVPYIGNKSTPPADRDYSSTVKVLGQKASHGCIRVQKAANEQGQNIEWLWNNIKVNTKVLIWDDTGRIRPYPVADDYELYFNPNGGQYYHENQYCTGVKSRFLPLSPFTYGELDTDAFSKLIPCPKCTSSILLRKSKIDAMNKLENPDQ